MDRVITVTGAGKAAAAPDQVRIDGSVNGRCGRYAEAVERSAAAIGGLRKAVMDAGFDGEMLRTTGLSVSAVYRRGEDGSSVFDCFSYSHGIRITAGAGDDGLGRLLEALLSCDSAPEFRVSYAVSDPSGPMAEARRAAVEDARKRAEELAEAAGVRLGAVVSVSYVSSPCNVATPRMRALSAVDAGIVPEDAEFSDSVTVQWEIEGRA